MCTSVGELCIHSRVETTSVSVNVLKYSGVAHEFAGAGTLDVKAS